MLNDDRASTQRLASAFPQGIDGTDQRYRLLAITPFERPDPALACAALRRGAGAAVDLGRDTSTWASVLQELGRQRQTGLGLRIPDGVAPPDLDLPKAVSFLILDGNPCILPAAWRSLPWVAQVCSVEEARVALDCGAVGLIAKGQESGGRVGRESSFVLLQRLVGLTAERAVNGAPKPVWCQGGIALNTAAAAFAGGAYGVILDTALSLLPECGLSAGLKSMVMSMDGSETREASGYHVYSRRQRDLGDIDALEPEGVRDALARGDLLPVGQDAALARLVSAECANLETLVSGLRHRVPAQVAQAVKLAVLGEGNPWAQAHGVRYPAAQGPMTRVSDTAAFAASVAEAGGLPMLALSMMREPACRELLQATAERLGPRPWGVGVLGFADPETLQPQLQLLHEIKPSVILLAGGRPWQARPFVEAGIAVYLHVPSPDLLDLFLKEGATHFVFEGRECGGHVGPRYSFVLWEQAIARLLRCDDLESVHVLFAGGIHDERSAAMVAVLAAPLAARGAKVGVLMGTAYVATAEAVRDGAILEGFQQKALAGFETALIETAPGHAIRCLPSQFMDAFAGEKARLAREGIDSKEIWKRLELLTVGRLRVATKGIDHVDGALAQVPAAVQEADGMYMIGQVIALKKAVISIAELHAQVSVGACAYLQRLPGLPMVPDPELEPIAVIGMACIYPGSPDLEGYWTNILEARDLVTEVPPERWNVPHYYRGANAPSGKSVSKWGGFIPDTAFDPMEYGIPPASLAAIEPVQLLSLEVSRQALHDAGYAERTYDKERTSVIFGAEAGMDLGNQYTFRNLYPQYCGEMPEALAKALPSLTEDSFPGMLVNVISGRIANRLGLGGVNYAVTSACASSLTAVELAVKELRSGSSEMVLAGGADFHNGVGDFLLFSSVGALSAKGRCRSFDSEADGIALGEGVGVVVLKRLRDAERDGDRIYALIDGIAGSSDGKGLGLTAPRKEGQKRALERAYWQAGVLPASVGLVEAHGTGTVVGDRTELDTLTEVYGAGGAVAGQTVLGSVKSQIGHTKCAAGIAGLIKVAKALYHEVLPPTGLIASPNAGWRQRTSPFVLNREPSPWIPSNGIRRAAVSAFGFGGANFHAVLSAHSARSSTAGAVALPAELFAVRGGSLEDAQATARSLGAYVAASDASVTLRDLARLVWESADGPVQIAFVASSMAELTKKLNAASQRHADAGVRYRSPVTEGKLALLFPGQGSQYVGMLRELLVYFHPDAGLMDAARTELPFIYPAAAYDDDTRGRQHQALTDTRRAQPALGLVEMSTFRWLRELGVRPDMAAGHSYGELVALASAGAYDSASLLRLSRARAGAMVAAAPTGDPGAMAAVSLDAEALAPLLSAFPQVVMANRNSPAQTVISGPTADVQAACAVLDAQKIASKRIATDRAFHSPLMAAAELHFSSTLRDQAMGPLSWPVYSNATAMPYAGDASEIRQGLARQLASPVRFVEQVRQMHRDGARVFLEVGPRRALTSFVGRILKDLPHTAISIDPEGRGIAGLLGSVAELAVVLHHFDATALYAGRTRKLDPAQPKTRAGTTWVVNGGRSWPLNGKLPAHAGTTITAPVIDTARATGDTPSKGDPMPAKSGTPEAQALVSYLQNMREVVNAQRDVLLGYFGSPSKAKPPKDTVAAASPAPEHRAESDAAKAPAISSPRASTAGDVTAVLLQTVSERTGYPADSLDLDLDLEADLSIDSIKRVEVVGEVSQKLSLRNQAGPKADAILDQLAQMKTLRAMLDCLTQTLAAGAGGSSAVTAQADAPAPRAVPCASDAAGRPDLHVQTPIVDVADTVRGVLSQATGYPPDALELDLDLEADLSIDSIKRVEVSGQLVRGVALDPGSDRDALMEKLSRLKSIRQIVEALQPHLAGTREVAAPAAAAEAKIPLTRYVLRRREAPCVVPGVNDLAGMRFLVSDDRMGVAPRLADCLRRRGASAKILDFAQTKELPGDLDDVDGLIHLWSLNPASNLRDVQRFFAVAREALQKKARHLVVASALGGDFGASGSGFRRGGGFAGLVKSVAHEFSQLRAHWIDFDLADSVEAIAGAIEAELTAANGLVEVAYQGGRRYSREIVEAKIAEDPLEGLPLNAKSTVLITGGARGVTSLIALELARRYRCHLEIVGRSAAPAEDERASTAGIADPKRLRQVLLQEMPGSKPVEIERRAQQILRDRALRDTLTKVIAAGGSVNYACIDVRDSRAFLKHIDSIYTRRPQIDGVIHGAGVIEDKLVRDKSNESFGRVFDTKVRGAMALSKRIRDDVKFVVFFSSVASAFGNRGQVDYASANDVLDKLAHSWQQRIPGRVVSVNWGPWADTGMVSDALRSDFLRRGIGLIAQEEGVRALLQELSVQRHEPQVVLMCGTPNSFAPRSDARA